MNNERLETIRVNDRVDMPTFAHQHRRELLAYVDELRAENQRAADEIDSLNQSLDRARTDWHDLAAERDQARQIARDLATALTTAVRELDGEHDLHTLAVAWGHWPTADGPSDWLLNDALPDWLTENGGAK